MLTDGSADRIITARELANAGVVSILGNGALALPEGSSLVQSPPAPTNVAATGAVSNIFVEWDVPIYRGHAYAEIWSSPTDDLGAAVLAGMAPGSLFLDAVGFSTTRYYWVRFVNALDEKGPYNGISGASAATAVDVDYLLGVLEGEITESQLYADLGARIDLIDGPPTLNGSVAQRVAAEATARVTADSALASSITTLGATVTAGDSQLAAAIQAESTTRATAIQAEAAARQTLQSTVEANNTTLSAAVQTEASTRAAQTGELYAKYGVKLDVNGYVTGWAMNNDGSTGNMIVLADKFAVGAPGAGNIAPFIVQTTPTTINGVEVPIGVYMRDAFIQNGTITNAKIANLAVDDAKIASLSVGKLLAGSIAVGRHIQSTGVYAGDGSPNWRIDGDGLAVFNNAIVRGTVYATDGQFVGEVIAQDAGGNKARMWAGDFEVYKQVPNVGQVLYKALSRVESGVGANNVQVTIPGYFLNQPRVIVSPANIKLYDAAYANQSQSVQCEVRDLIESPAGSMVWKFTPLATLSLAANTGQTVINQASGTISTNWTSSQYTTAANTLKITPSVRLASYRGNGASQWYLRTVRWRLEYLSGGSWIADSWTTINLGADTNASVASDKLFTFPSSGTWTFRIAFEAYDYSPSTLFGSIEYNYHTGTVSAAGPAAVQDYRLGTYNTTLTLPGFSPPAGYSVYQVDYSVNWSWSRNGTNGSVTVDGSLVKASTSTGTSGSGTKTRTSSSYNVNELDLSMQITALGSGFGGENMYAQLSNGSATIKSRQAKPNSTTAANTFSLNSYTYELPSAQVLATGTLNWVAIGE